MLFLLGMSQWCRDRTRISSDLRALLSSWQLSKLHALSLSSVGPTEADVLYIRSNLFVAVQRMINPMQIDTEKDENDERADDSCPICI